MKKLKHKCGFIILVGFCLLGCATENPYVRTTQIQHSPPISLYPIPLEGQSVPYKWTIYTEKKKIAVEARMDRASFSDKKVYVLKLRITNSSSSILEVDTKKVFVRPVKVSHSFFERISGETAQEFLKNERLLYDKIGYPRDWETSMSFIFIGNEGFAIRKILSSTQLPRLGAAEGDLLFVKRDYQLEPDDLIVQLYLGSEEFTFRFSETTKQSFN